MKVLEQTQITLDWPDLNRLMDHPYGNYKRSGGLHVSEVIRHIAVKGGLLTVEDKEDEAPIRALLGMGWERACAGLYDEIIWQPGELECDGLALSPDGYGTTRRTAGGKISGLISTIEEFKYTAKSARLPGGTPKQLKDITAEWMWMTQVMAYCYAASRVHKIPVNLARLHVCWCKGVYTHPHTEMYIRYLVEFTDRELRTNWSLLLGHKEEVLEARKAGGVK